MNAYEMYYHFLALRNHFNLPNFNYHTYQGKSSASVKTFEKHRDRFYYINLSRQLNDPVSFMLANIVNYFPRKKWIGEFEKSIYLSWMKRTQSLTCIFQNELDKLEPDFDSNFLIKDGEHSNIIRLFFGKKICIETLAILLDITNAWCYYSTNLSQDVLWSQLELLLKKYIPFLEKSGYDRHKFRCLTRERFKEEEGNGQTKSNNRH